MTRPGWVLTLAALFGPAMVLAADGVRQFVELGVGRGLDARVAVAMLVDRDGLLWVGSREGLFRYDGYQATAFLPDPDRAGQISDIDIRALYEADDGALWISTNTGGLNRRDPRSGTFTQYHRDSAVAGSLSDESVYGVAEDAEGRLWVGTQRGLNRLDESGQRFERYFHEPGRDDSLANDWVYALHHGPSGTLWVATVGGGLGRWTGDGSSFENFALAARVGGARGLDDVFAVYEAPDGHVWAGTRAGLVVLDPRGRTAERVDLTGAAEEQPLITTLRADSSGRLWVGSLDHGVFSVDTSTRAWERTRPGAAGEAGSLPNIPIISIATTDHLLLVGTWGQGVFRAPIDPPPFRLLTTGSGESGLRHANITAVLAGDEPGRPWVGSFGGGPQQVDVATGVAAPSGSDPGEPIRLSGVVSLAVTQDGTRFAGTTEGLFRHGADGRQLGLDAHAKDDRDSIGPGYVAALLPAGNDLWVGVGGAGLFRRDGGTGRFEAYPSDPSDPVSLSGDYVTALLAGRDGALWVGTRSNGLNRCRIDPFACERFDGREPGRPALGHHQVTALRADGRDGMWVATSGGGLRRARLSADGQVLGFDGWGLDQGLLSDGVMAVESDIDGLLWLATRQGLTHLDPLTGRVVNHVRESGLPVSHFNTGASAADERYLYFGSVNGLVSVPKGLPLRPRPPSPVRITGAERLVGGQAVALVPDAIDGPLEIGIDTVLAAEFAVVDLTETAHEYSYRLQANVPWIPLGRRRQLTFVGLAPGQYALEVRGRDAFGGWSASVPFEFEVVPPFWMTTWFRGLAIAAVVLLALGAHLVRLRALRTRNAVLERLQLQREQALSDVRRSQAELEEAYAGLRQLTMRLESAKEDERSRISRELHDELGQTLTAAKLNLQMLRTTISDRTAGRRLDDAVGMVDGMIRQARDIARGLRPPLLDEAGLVPAIEHYLKSLAARAGTCIEFDANPGVARTPVGLSLTIFRLVQEAVSNALRHAGAGAIRVTLRDETDALSLVVADDGVGFDVPAARGSAQRGEHLGLLGMTERVRNAGGTIEFASAPGAGTRITARIPYARQATGRPSAAGAQG
ncbi:MAG TPA: two-component regulator propeller domain-containing protein [Steroidobacteraceae bacterium]|nr:two-component regulator propeller domain-containing protein [Steroidobacteraceae bacterium]